MRRILLALPVALLALFLAAPAALAASPHFVSASAAFQGSGPNLNVSFKEAGLGNNQTITYLASADATATYACINGGGNHPSAANKETVSGPVSAAGTFTSGKNGSISQTLTLFPPSAGSFACPSGQKLTLAFVSYTMVQIEDTTNMLTESIPGTFSRCLVTGDLATELCPA
ncbi:MAG TPA: hypothetical protein DHU96_02630 [Actinobacteria bacterium]|nr:hypothetical protein [Actinomycetota bacterium]